MPRTDYLEVKQFLTPIRSNCLKGSLGASNAFQSRFRECFLDLGSFLDDKKIPLDVLINIWMERRDPDEEDAFAVLVELSNKNLPTLVKDAHYVICVPLLLHLIYTKCS